MTATLIEPSHSPLHHLDEDRMTIASFHDACRGFEYGPQTQYGYSDNEKSLDEQNQQFELSLEIELESSSDESDSSDDEDLSPPEIDFAHTSANSTYILRRQSLNLLPKRIKSVTWAGSVVTDVFFRPKVTMKEKKELFYDSTDMQR